MFGFVRYAVALAQVTWNTPLTFMKYGNATVKLCYKFTHCSNGYSRVSIYIVASVWAPTCCPYCSHR